MLSNIKEHILQVQRFAEHEAMLAITTAVREQQQQQGAYQLELAAQSAAREAQQIAIKYENTAQGSLQQHGPLTVAYRLELGNAQRGSSPT